MPFLSYQKIGGHLGPLPLSFFFPKSSDQNSEIVIFFCIVEKPYNYVFGDDLLPPQSPWEGLQVTNFDQCLHIVMVFGEFANFSGGFLVGRGVEKRGLCGGCFPWKNFSWGKKISIKGAQHFLALLKKTMKK